MHRGNVRGRFERSQLQHLCNLSGKIVQGENHSVLWLLCKCSPLFLPHATPQSVSTDHMQKNIIQCCVRYSVLITSTHFHVCYRVSVHAMQCHWFCSVHLSMNMLKHPLCDTTHYLYPDIDTSTVVLICTVQFPLCWKKIYGME